MAKTPCQLSLTPAPKLRAIALSPRTTLFPWDSTKMPPVSTASGILDIFPRLSAAMISEVATVSSVSLTITNTA